MKTIMILLVLLASAQAFAVEKLYRKTDTSHSQRGDTQMGADATSSGTDITDQDLQAQEDLEGNVIYLPDDQLDDDETKSEEQEEIIKK